MFTTGISALLASASERVSTPEGLFAALGRLETFIVELSESLSESKPEHAVAAAFLSDDDIVSAVRSMCAEYLLSAWFMGSLNEAIKSNSIPSQRFTPDAIVKAMTKLQRMAKPVGETGAKVEQALEALMPAEGTAAPVALSEKGL